MFEHEFNYINEENNTKIIYCSSQTKGCDCKNILSNNRKSIWLSEKNIPQIIIIDISKIEKKPENSFFKYFGIYCWHAYSTNPKIIQLLVSENNKNYFDLGNYELIMSPKTQYFQIENLEKLKNKKIKFIKLIIKETFGGSRTYINQIFFYDDQSEINNNEIDDTFQLTINNEIDDNNNIDEKYLKKNNDNINYFNKNNKKNRRKTEELDENEKERKLKKIEKILKTKILSNNINLENESIENEHTNKKLNKDLFLNEENEEDKISSHFLSYGNSNFNSAKNKSEEYNYMNNNNRTENTFSPEITNSSNFNFNNIPKRTMTPLPKGSKLLFRSPDNTLNYINTNPNFNYKISLNSDKEYKRLEAQLKEMEDKLKSLNNEKNLINKSINNINNSNNNNSKNITHSKSFSFLPKEQNNNSIGSNNNTNNFINIQKEINTDNNNNILINNNDTLNLPVQSTNRNLNMNTNSNRQFIENLNNLNTNRILQTERINVIEQRMINLENEIKGIKDQFTILSKNIQLLVNTKTNNNLNTEQIIQIVLKECIKIIENKFNEIQHQNNQTTNNRLSNEYNTNNNNLYVSTDSNLYSFEMRLNKKIDERLDLLANHIQEQLNNNFLKPSIQSIENTMKNNMNEIKEKLNQINTHSNNNLLNQSETSFIDSIKESKSLLGSQSDIKNSTLKRNEQYDEINKLGEKLYDKLVEKEKKLEEFKIETNNYFKKRMKKDDKKIQDSLNSLK